MILLDEPFSALDICMREQLQTELMEMIKDYEGIVILVSHNPNEVYRMSEELLILEDGEIVGQGETKKLFHNPENIAAARITGYKNIVEAAWEDSGDLMIKDWNLKFSLKKQPDKKVTAVAIHAHEFRMKKIPENEYLCFPVLEPVITEDLFEYNISFKTAEDAVSRVEWKISKYDWEYGENSVPKKIYLNEKDLHFL